MPKLRICSRQSQNKTNSLRDKYAAQPAAHTPHKKNQIDDKIKKYALVSHKTKQIDDKINHTPSHQIDDKI